MNFLKILLIKNKLELSIVCILVFFLSCLYLFEKHRYKLSDTALFGSDTWQYQSLGVNLCLGHGYKAGGIEKFDTYKFYATKELRDAPYYPLAPKANISSKENFTMYSYFVKGGEYFFFRTPGYPFFLAAVYRLFGIHPYVVEIIQIILLAFCASLMPIIGMYYWSRLGIYSGLFSSFIFIRYSPDPSEIMSEPLFILCLFILAIIIMLWENKPSNLRTFLLGIMSAVSLLVKGIATFLPLLLLMHINFASNKPGVKLKLSLIFMLGFFFCILPWSTYATKKSGRFIFLATQVESLLLDSNNEDTLKTTHDAAPGWRKWNRDDSKYLYNRLKNTNYSYIKKTFIYLSQNKKDIPLLLKHKLKRGFFVKWRIPLVITGMFLYYLTSIFTINSKFSIGEKIPIFPILYFLNIFLMTLIFFGLDRYTLPFIIFSILPATYILFKISKLIFFREKIYSNEA